MASVDKKTLNSSDPNNPLTSSVDTNDQSSMQGTITFDNSFTSISDENTDQGSLEDSLVFVAETQLPGDTSSNSGDIETLNAATNDGYESDVIPESQPIDTIPETQPIDTIPETQPIDTTPETQPLDTIPETQPIDTIQNSQPDDDGTEASFVSALSNVSMPMFETTFSTSSRDLFSNNETGSSLGSKSVNTPSPLSANIIAAPKNADSSKQNGSLTKKQETESAQELVTKSMKKLNQVANGSESNGVMERSSSGCAQESPGSSTSTLCSNDSSSRSLDTLITRTIMKNSGQHSLKSTGQPRGVACNIANNRKATTSKIPAPKLTALSKELKKHPHVVLERLPDTVRSGSNSLSIGQKSSSPADSNGDHVVSEIESMDDSVFESNQSASTEKTNKDSTFLVHEDNDRLASARNGNSSNNTKCDQGAGKLDLTYICQTPPQVNGEGADDNTKSLDLTPTPRVLNETFIHGPKHLSKSIRKGTPGMNHHAPKIQFPSKHRNDVADSAADSTFSIPSARAIECLLNESEDKEQAIRATITPPKTMEISKESPSHDSTDSSACIFVRCLDLSPIQPVELDGNNSINGENISVNSASNGIPDKKPDKVSGAQCEHKETDPVLKAETEVRSPVQLHNGNSESSCKPSDEKIGKDLVQGVMQPTQDKTLEAAKPVLDELVRSPPEIKIAELSQSPESPDDDTTCGTNNNVSIPLDDSATNSQSSKGSGPSTNSGTSETSLTDSGTRRPKKKQPPPIPLKLKKFVVRKENEVSSSSSGDELSNMTLKERQKKKLIKKAPSHSSKTTRKADREVLNEMIDPKPSTSGPLRREIERNKKAMEKRAVNVDVESVDRIASRPKIFGRRTGRTRVKTSTYQNRSPSLEGKDGIEKNPEKQKTEFCQPNTRETDGSLSLQDSSAIPEAVRLEDKVVSSKNNKIKKTSAEEGGMSGGGNKADTNRTAQPIEKDNSNQKLTDSAIHGDDSSNTSQVSSRTNEEGEHADIEHSLSYGDNNTQHNIIAPPPQFTDGEHSENYLDVNKNKTPLPKKVNAKEGHGVPKADISEEQRPRPHISEGDKTNAANAKELNQKQKVLLTSSNEEKSESDSFTNSEHQKDKQKQAPQIMDDIKHDGDVEECVRDKAPTKRKVTKNGNEPETTENKSLNEEISRKRVKKEDSRGNVQVAHAPKVESSAIATSDTVTDKDSATADATTEVDMHVSLVKGTEACQSDTIGTSGCEREMSQEVVAESLDTEVEAHLITPIPKKKARIGNSKNQNQVVEIRRTERVTRSRAKQLTDVALQLPNTSTVSTVPKSISRKRKNNESEVEASSSSTVKNSAALFTLPSKKTACEANKAPSTIVLSSDTEHECSVPSATENGVIKVKKGNVQSRGKSKTRKVTANSKPIEATSPQNEPEEVFSSRGRKKAAVNFVSQSKSFSSKSTKTVSKVDKLNLTLAVCIPKLADEKRNVPDGGKTTSGYNKEGLQSNAVIAEAPNSKPQLPSSDTSASTKKGGRKPPTSRSKSANPKSSKKADEPNLNTTHMEASSSEQQVANDETSSSKKGGKKTAMSHSKSFNVKTSKKDPEPQLNATTIVPSAVKKQPSSSSKGGKKTLVSRSRSANAKPNQILPVDLPINATTVNAVSSKSKATANEANSSSKGSKKLPVRRSKSAIAISSKDKSSTNAATASTSSKGGKKTAVKGTINLNLKPTKNNTSLQLNATTTTATNTIKPSSATKGGKKPTAAAKSKNDKKTEPQSQIDTATTVNDESLGVRKSSRQRKLRIGSDIPSASQVIKVTSMSFFSCYDSQIELDHIEDQYIVV